MTFAKKVHAECQKVVGTEVNQHSDNTLATHVAARTKSNPAAIYVHIPQILINKIVMPRMIKSAKISQKNLA